MVSYSWKYYVQDVTCLCAALYLFVFLLKTGPSLPTVSLTHARHTRGLIIRTKGAAFYKFNILVTPTVSDGA
jgi:hypothetical protein